MKFLLTIIQAVGLGCASAAAGRRVLHYLQLESYQLPGYVKSVRRNAMRALIPPIAMAAVGVAALRLSGLTGLALLLEALTAALLALAAAYPIAGMQGEHQKLAVVLALALIFNLNHKMYVTLLPKSITTAIGMGVSEELGGAVTITVAVIIITGVLGNMLAETLCKLFHIEEPIAKGISIGSASHAIGTAKAMEMGDVEGAMSSLSIAVAGILTVVGASIYAMFI